LIISNLKINIIFINIKFFLESNNLNEKHLSEDDKYYLTMNYVVSQLDGLFKGQLEGALKYGKTPLTKEQIYHIVMQADLNDLFPAFNAGHIAFSPDNYNNNSSNDLINKNKNELDFLRKECTGFIKIDKKTNNLISSHNTHNIYSLMNRIFKYYDFNVKLNNKRINSYRFSSRPADLNSKDDYYTLSNNMVVMETSLEIYDYSIYKNLKIETVPKWIRINIANKLADNNLEWIDLFFKHNSGTHNNQWLIVDYKKFENYIQNQEKFDSENTFITEIQNKIISLDLNSKEFFKNELNLNNDKNLTLSKNIKNLGIVHLVEQIPVLEKSYFKDFSEELIRDGYVASYNAPFFDEVIELAGYKKYNKKDYFTANRYFLFKKFSDSIKTIEDVKTLIRYHDENEMCDTIAPRCDIFGNNPFGAVDAKITDSNLLKEMKSQIVYGPPHIKGVSEPFNFTKFNDYSHLGIPEYFDFDWIEA